MKSVNIPNYTKYIFLFTAVLAFMLASGCTLDGISDEPKQSEVTEADLEAAGKILGESLSDENDGVMASLNDALSTVSSSGLEKAPATSGTESTSVQTHDDDSNSGRGSERNFSYHYDPETGTHTITFERIVYNEGYFKSVKDTLKYIFTNNNGEFIAHPRLNRERIETIDFKGFKEGQIESQIKESHFVRQDTFFIDGVSEASSILSIDGVHHGSGELHVQDEQGNQIGRNYTTVINFLEIQIDKTVVAENRSLEFGVTGTLSWEMVVTKSNNGSSETKTINGTIEMNGDGTALLKFKRFSKLFLINLDDGDVRDHDDEFEGRVKRVNIEENTFTLASGRTVQMTNATKIEAEGDVTSLQEVAHALESDSYVKAEGTGYVEGEIFVATEVEFEVEEKDERQFEGLVTDVNLETGIITLNGEHLIRFDGSSVFSESGDLYSLEGVYEAYANDYKVYAHGYGKIDNDSDAALLAIEAKFKAEAPGEETFEGYVTSVNLEAGTFILDNELVIRIGAETIISGSGDLHSLVEVAESLELGHGVVAFGEGKIDSKTDATLVGIEVKFKVEEDNSGSEEDGI